MLKPLAETAQAEKSSLGFPGRIHTHPKISLGREPYIDLEPQQGITSSDYQILSGTQHRLVATPSSCLSPLSKFNQASAARLFCLKKRNQHQLSKPRAWDCQAGESQLYTGPHQATWARRTSAPRVTDHQSPCNGHEGLGILSSDQACIRRQTI